MYIVYKAKATTITSTTLTHYIYTLKKNVMPCIELHPLVLSFEPKVLSN